MSQFQVFVGFVLMQIAAAVMLAFIYVPKWRKQHATQPGQFDRIAASYAGYHALVLTHGKWPSAHKVVEGIAREKSRLEQQAGVLGATLKMTGFDPGAVSSERTEKFLDEVLRLRLQYEVIPKSEPTDEIVVLTKDFFGAIDRVITLANERKYNASALKLEHWKTDVSNWFCVVTFRYHTLIKLGDSTEWHNTT